MIRIDMPGATDLSRTSRLAAPFLFVIILSGCACQVERPPGLAFNLPVHNSTNVQLEFRLAGDPFYLGKGIQGESAQLVSDRLAEELELIGPSGLPIEEPFLEVPADVSGSIFVLSFAEGPGWYTVRLWMTEGDTYYECREVQPGLCENDVLVGASEPGIRDLFIGQQSTDEPALVTIQYSETVRHEGFVDEMFELLDASDVEIDCWRSVPVMDDPAAAPPETWPEPDGPWPRDSDYLECDGRQAPEIVSIRVKDAAWSDDMSVRAVFPPENEPWVMDLVAEDPQQPNRRRWEPDRRSFSAQRLGSEQDQLRRAQPYKHSAAPGSGCSVARPDPRTGSPAAVVIVALLYLVARSASRRS